MFWLIKVHEWIQPKPRFVAAAAATTPFAAALRACGVVLARASLSELLKELVN